MLLTVFLFDGMVQPSSPLAMAKGKLQSLNLLPVTRQDLLTIMTNPFIEKPLIILEYAREEMDMDPKAIKELVHEVVVLCLGIGSKVSIHLFFSMSAIFRLYRGKPLED